MRHRMIAYCAGLLCLLSLVAPGPRASAEPLRIARLQHSSAALPPPQALVQGALDVQFEPMRQNLLRAPNDRSAWYRLQLQRDWSGTTSPLLVIGGDTRARVTVYLPPLYAPRQVSPYDADQDPRFSRHALVLELPMDLRADQPVYLELGAPRDKASR